MCGIHLLVNPSRDGQDQIEKMMLATQHRGPDQSGFEHFRETCWLGANRLKILDLTDAASQPMWTEDRRALIAWNGAIYNYKHLQATLQDIGYTFRTQSDTEVLLYWLCHFGEKGLSDLNGMFSLIFVNIEKGEILVARDPTGQKPLYCFQENQTWIFSSETKAVRKAVERPLEIDDRQFLPYSHYRFSWPNGSFFKGVSQVMPGECITLDFQGNLSRRQLISANPKTDQNTEDWESILGRSVLQCFHADRSAGLILSGGIDSSMLYALWYEQTGTPLPAFTAHFGRHFEKEFPDLKFAELLAHRYPCRHEGIEISKESLMELWPSYIQSVDQPVGDGAGFLTWLISKHVQNDVKILVSGAGADELFGGYNRHKAFLRFLQFPRMLGWLAGTLSKSGAFPADQKLALSLEEDPIHTFIQMAALHPIPSEQLPLFSKYFPNESGLLKSALAFDRQFYLVNDILKIHDGACMAHGIEGRSPYLDRDLVSFATRMSEDEVKKNIGKKNLKLALDKRDLQAISNRKKQGFGMPLREWLRDASFREYVFGPILQMDKIWGDHFPLYMRTLMKHPEKLVDAHFLLLWNWFVLASWLQHHR